MPKANPLKPGKTKAAVAANIARLKRDGYPQAQAVAIALREARTPGRKLPHAGRANPKGPSLKSRGFTTLDTTVDGWKVVRDKSYYHYILRPDGSEYGKYQTSGAAATAMAVLVLGGKAGKERDKGQPFRNPTKRANYSYPDIASIKKVLGASTVSRLVNATYPRLAISRAHERLMGKHDFVKAEAVAALERYVKKAEGRRENPGDPRNAERDAIIKVLGMRRFMSISNANDWRAAIISAHSYYVKKGDDKKARAVAALRVFLVKWEAKWGKRGNPSTSTSSDVRSPTKTSTSTYAHTAGNITVTGGAGAGATTSVVVRRNPSVLDISEMFQGDTSGKVVQLKAANGAPANLSRAGKLASLKLADRRATVRIPGAVVCIDTKKRLWLAGPRTPMFNRKANKGEGLDYGEIDTIAYVTAKSHVGNGRTFEYVHNFGEDGGRKPHLIIDDEGMAIIKGGDYQIREEGIID